MNREEYDKVLKTGMFWEWFPNLSGEWEKDQEEFINELRNCRLVKSEVKISADAIEPAAEFLRKRNKDVISGEKVLPNVPFKNLSHSILTVSDLEFAAEYLLNKIPTYIKGFIELNIMQAQGYFVGEWKMFPETSGRRVLTKTGWKGVKDFVAKYSPESFRVTYNGVKYEIEDNEELFEKLFEHEL